MGDALFQTIAILTKSNVISRAYDHHFIIFVPFMLTMMIGSSFHVSEAGEPETHRWEVVAGVDHGNERKPTCDSMMSSTPIPCSGAFVAKSGLRTTVR